MGRFQFLLNIMGKDHEILVKCCKVREGNREKNGGGGGGGGGGSSGSGGGDGEEVEDEVGVDPDL
ncbi:hypothetical protein HanPI659440_Chr05g0206621 [Helianthus annuus]|nr:hypothetical protein HanPI659440_Chr05g0206621 [Helianthus annuus]